MRILYVLLFVVPTFLFSQQIITGNVIDSENNPLFGVSVLEMNSQNGILTSESGTFQLTVQENAILQFSMVGFETQTKATSASDLKITIQLKESALLQEVVITALGLSRNERELSYAHSSVDGKTMTYGRSQNFGNGLAGLVSGLNVTGLATGPGGSSRLVIRGYNSISQNNQPLFIIDGIPIDNTSQGQPNQDGGVDYGDGIGSLNSSDIENVTVLKGHAAAALYGSKASNGVVLVTTKKGNTRKGIGVDVNFNQSWDQAQVNMNLQQGYGQGWVLGQPPNQGAAAGDINAAWGTKLGSGENIIQFDGVERPWSPTGNRFDEFYRLGSNQFYQVGLTGGDVKSNFRFAFSDMKSEAILPNSGYDRRNFTLNAGSQINKWLRIQASAQYILENGKNRPNVAGFGLNPNLSLAGIAPNVPLSAIAGENGDGSTPSGQSELSVGFMNNPYWSLYRVKKTDDKNRFIGSLESNLNLSYGIYGLFRIGTDQYTANRSEVTPRGTLYGETGSINQQKNGLESVQIDAILGKKGRFASDFGYDLFIGSSRNDVQWDWQGIAGNTIILDGVDNPTNQVNTSPYAGKAHKRTNSIYGSAAFSWKSLVYLNFTGRNDWFSTLPADNNTLFFPSAGLSFLFSEAWNMPNWLTHGKFRSSWSSVSGDADPYLLNPTYRAVGQGHFGFPLNEITNQTIQPQNLRPLLSQEIEFGLDLRLFQNRLGLDVAVYQQKTQHDITRIQVSNSSGFSTALTNDGSVQNRGLEVSLNISPIKRSKFSWDVALNLAKNWNKILNLGPNVDNQQLAQTNNQGLGFVHHVVGQPASAIMGFAYARDANGNIIYNESLAYGADGSVVSANYTPVQGAYTVLGNGVHDFTSGLNNTLNFGAFSLDFLIDFKTGGEIFSASNAWMYTMGYSPVTEEARLNDYPIQGVRASDGQAIDFSYSINDDSYANDCYICHFSAVSSTISEEFVYDATFAKLRQVAFSWNLPNHFSEKIRAQSASVSLVGRNLALLYSKVPNIDPESGYLSGNAQGIEFFGLPPTRSFGFDVRVKF